MSDRPVGTLARQPRGPVLGWRSFEWTPGEPAPPHVMALPHRRITSSGRAALWQALAGLAMPKGTSVLVPTYHCPTLVAPVAALKLVPRYYPIDDKGLPRIDEIGRFGAGAGAIIVPHFFGRVQSLADVRRWCDEQDVVLIEDCAHALFGQAGERPVGSWGDLATASLTKFLPVSEGGVLASAVRPLPALATRHPGLRQQLKSFVDLADRRPSGGPLRAFRRRSMEAVSASDPTVSTCDETDGLVQVSKMMDACDMGRVDQSPALLTSALVRLLPLAVSVKRRRANFDRFSESLAGLKGARPVWVAREPESVPYVYPLWVDEPEPLYLEMRSAGLAVLRWDRTWPGTPAVASDSGAAWRRHVLQLLCHQDLSPVDIDETASWLRSRCGVGPTAS